MWHSPQNKSIKPFPTVMLRFVIMRMSYTTRAFADAFKTFYVTLSQPVIWGAFTGDERLTRNEQDDESGVFTRNRSADFREIVYICLMSSFYCLKSGLSDHTFYLSSIIIQLSITHLITRHRSKCRFKVRVPLLLRTWDFNVNQ